MRTCSYFGNQLFNETLIRNIYNQNINYKHNYKQTYKCR
ncbi:protein of unknown function [Clostridium beijerinckii]|nr:protein of unknown function [Clostridium beijerinckii]